LPIEIQNGLWEDPPFKQFWQHAFLRGFIDTDGGRLLLPKTLQLVQPIPYFAAEKLSFFKIKEDVKNSSSSPINEPPKA
jgi:hypothetical protein